MARIAGVELPRDKRVEIALTYIFGIGRSLAKRILQQTGVNPDKRVKDLTESEVNILRETIERNYKVEGDLRHRVLPGAAAQNEPAGARPADPDERPDPEGSAEDGARPRPQARRQEEVSHPFPRRRPSPGRWGRSSGWLG